MTQTSPPFGAPIEIREAIEEDFLFVVRIMNEALSRFYDGDHTKHAERIFSTHICGGEDRLGFFSTFQKMFIATIEGQQAGMIHLVGKRQGTLKISPLIIDPKFRRGHKVGSALLELAESYAREHSFRQIYCTVAKENESAARFFIKNKFNITGQSDGHYKNDVSELMLYKTISETDFEQRFDRDHISVLPLTEQYNDQVRHLLLQHLPSSFLGIDDQWVDSLFAGYARRIENPDVNSKYKLIYVAIDRQERVRGVVGATPKKGAPIKLMPCIALDLPSFVALVKDTPFFLLEYGHKLYAHLAPEPDEVIALQQAGWKLNGALPAAYHPNVVTQQWSLDINEVSTMRNMRVKDPFLRHIEVGRKDLEVRVGYGTIKSIRVGNTLEFSSRIRSVHVRVVAIRNYVSFDELLENESPDRIVPGETKESLLRILRDIYPQAKEALGVVVLQIELVNKTLKSSLA